MNIRRLIIPLTLAFACTAANADDQNPKPASDLKVVKTTTILDEKTMAFTYGRMMARNCLGIQIAIDNPNPDKSYVVNGVIVRVGEDEPRIGNLGRSVATSMAQRGAIKDRRNVWFRTLNSISLVAASVGTFTQVGPSYAPAVAAFAGPFIQGFSNLFPDVSVAQVSNVTADAFQPNLVISKDGGHASMTAFFSLKDLMSEADLKKFRREPHDFLKDIHVYIRGTYVAFSATDAGTDSGN